MKYTWLLYFGQVWNDRNWIFGTNYDRIDITIENATYLFWIEWISYIEKSCLDTIYKPRSIIGNNIGSTTDV